jgi:hydrogenase maturation protease
MNILVLGIGNLLLSDEGAGVRALEAIEQRFDIPPGVELLDGGTSGMELLGYLQGRDAVIIIDAVTCGKPPGTIVRLEGDQVPALFRRKISPHQLGLSDLLAAARLTDSLPAEVILIGVEPKELGTGLKLSNKVAGVMEELAVLVALELESLGARVAMKKGARRMSPRPGGSAYRTTLPLRGR